jgi:hypothetical protein
VVRSSPTGGRRARALLHDAVRLDPTALSELRGLALAAANLRAFDLLVPTITALGEVAMLVLTGLLLADGHIHQALHVARLYKFGDGHEDTGKHRD